MSVFIFLKQIIDIFYDCHLLDYIMSAFVVLLIMVQIYYARQDSDEKNGETIGKAIEKKPFVLAVPDICIMSLALIMIIHFVIDGAANAFVYAKVMSAFALYLLGRLAAKRISECTWVLAISSYITVYVNLILAIITFGVSGLFKADNLNGLLYYSDTDLSYAVLLSLIFIAMYAPNRLLKFITIFAVCPFLIMHCDADIQKIMMVAVYVILFLFMAERAVKKRRITDFILPVAIVGLLIIITILMLPAVGVDSSRLVNSSVSYIIDTGNFSSRYFEWNNMIIGFKNAPTLEILFGRNMTFGSGLTNEYLSILQSTGIVGFVLFVIFVLGVAFNAIKIYERKTYYVTVMLAILFLGTCIVIDGAEYTQMSWFVMMYAGMAVSDGRVVRTEDEITDKESE